VTLIAIAGTFAGAAASGVVSVVPAGASPAARVARTIEVKDTAKLHEVHSNGNSRTETGPVTGTIPGMAYVTVNVSGAKASIMFRFELSGGTLRGRGTGTIHIGGGPYASLAGNGAITGGTGRYARASGSGRLYGAENRFSHSGTFEVIGRLKY